ncbi:sugar diacid recognition domain-containing protein [Sporosarcina sp. Marseille-Q4943]|uniref:CdaR family transcriptional regulator n=1 Tax=Sporosarcina sp. Marseille-Q4943 TaxID=2942204 RepID=UPI00208DAC32|nr:sugar diacid recognition domain-containing protein [Sporosarcina sp. Marseille-Q4943]
MFQFDTLGQEIVEELSNLIQEQVLLTDRRGFIQASTDPDRINQFHEGALLSLREKKILHMTEKEVGLLRGVRKGVVLPIIIEGEPIAVLGITGDPKHIHPQAQLILRVTELFIQDAMKRKQKEEKVRELEFFVFDWLTSGKKDVRFRERGAVLGIEVSLYKQVVVIEVMNTEDQFTIDEVDRFMSNQSIHPDLMMIRWGQDKILMLLPEMNQDILKSELEYFLLSIKRRKKISVAAGIGGQTDYFDLSKSFIQAERAANASKKLGRVLFEHELRFELILQSIGESTREEYIQRTVAPLLEDEELLHNLQVWFNENQSMQNTAQKLHIHKNTLSYRLQKVEQLTGLSVSNVHDVLLLYLGIRLLDEMK